MEYFFYAYGCSESKENFAAYFVLEFLGNTHLYPNIPTSHIKSIEYDKIIHAYAYSQIKLNCSKIHRLMNSPTFSTPTPTPIKKKFHLIFQFLEKTPVCTFSFPHIGCNEFAKNIYAYTFSYLKKKITPNSRIFRNYFSLHQPDFLSPTSDVIKSPIFFTPTPIP